MKIAIYPGTFDPLTNGHLDVALRAKRIFDKVYIMIAENPDKIGRYFLSLEDRLESAKAVFSKYEGFEVFSSPNLVVQEARRLGASALIRGIRAITDYEAEFTLHEVNEYLEPNVDMVYLMARKNFTFVSSSHIKELYHHGVDISSLVPEEVYQKIIKNKK